MKAIVYTHYGPPDVFQLQEVAKPTPKENEVLIKIHASTVGPVACVFRKGDPYIIRFVGGFFKPKFPIPGGVFAGEIEAAGKEVKLFKVGDQVFGATVLGQGCQAEYTCMPEAKTLAIKPANMSYTEAAGICDGSNTALTFLRDLAHLHRGQKVLINGASGSVGIAAVQLARYFGAEVTGVCSSANVELVKSLGADQVIDYTKADFTHSGETWDVIFDAVGKSSFSRCKDSLTQRGVYLSTTLTLAILLQMFWTSQVGSKKAIFATTGLTESKEKMKFLTELIEAGQLKTVIDRCYPLGEIAEAHRYVEKGHKKGDVVITVEHNNET
jgi:NADPH:quinone reductase-like Zn-dependent oxidoreductase